jgi:hypothetical protein
MSGTILVTDANALTQPIQDRMAQADEAAMLILVPA